MSLYLKGIGALSQGGCACVSISLGEPLSQVLSGGMSLAARSPHSTSSQTKTPPTPPPAQS